VILVLIAGMAVGPQQRSTQTLLDFTMRPAEPDICRSCKKVPGSLYTTKMVRKMPR
jgi:hypothetical protein